MHFSFHLDGCTVVMSANKYLCCVVEFSKQIVKCRDKFICPVVADLFAINHDLGCEFFCQWSKVANVSKEDRDILVSLDESFTGTIVLYIFLFCLWQPNLNCFVCLSWSKLSMNFLISSATLDAMCLGMILRRRLSSCFFSNFSLNVVSMHPLLSRNPRLMLMSATYLNSQPTMLMHAWKMMSAPSCW